jgi:hypothetical protein
MPIGTAERRAHDAFDATIHIERIRAPTAYMRSRVKRVIREARRSSRMLRASNSAAGLCRPAPFTEAPMLRRELRAHGPKDPARGIKSREGLLSNRLVGISVSRANSNFGGSNACRGHGHRERRRELRVQTGIIRPDLPAGRTRRARRSAIHPTG